jgi:hypothetical protein
MSDFEIPVRYKGEDLSIPAKVHRYGYTYKIEVEISGSKIFFERDNEGNWRALIAYDEIAGEKNVDRELLTAVAAVLDEVDG